MKQQDSGFLGDRERTPFQIGFAFLMRLLVGRGRERREGLRRRGAGIGALLKSTKKQSFRFHGRAQQDISLSLQTIVFVCRVACFVSKSKVTFRDPGPLFHVHCQR